MTEHQSFASLLDKLTGWRRLAAACALGAISVLAMPPIGWWPVLFATFPGLVLLLDRVAGGQPDLWRRVRAAALTGWWFGFGYLVPGLYWIGAAFLVEADKFAALMPFAITLLPAYLAFYYGAATGAAMLAWRPGPERLLALATAVAAGEWLRGHWFTGFPWNAVGYGLTINDALAQTASLVGLPGLSFWAVMVFSAPVLLLRGPARTGRSLPAACAIALLFAGALAWGEWRLAQPLPPDEPTVHLRLVQPNTPETEKFLPGSQRRIFDAILSLSQRNEAGRIDDLAGTTVLVWPEEPLNFLLLDSDVALKEIAAVLGGHTILLTGAFRAEAEPGAPDDAARRRIFNSLAVIDANGRPTAVYDKIHLVPWGEYLPWKPLLAAIGLSSIAGVTDEPGTNPRVLEAAGLPSLSPLICYEAIFPGAAVEAGHRPSWLLNVTNDAWFGEQTGPYQHFHQARVRAIEEGLPLVRVAVTGISAVVDARGRVRKSLQLLTAGVIDADLPGALPSTIYARYGDAILLSQLLVALTLLVVLQLAASRASR